MVLYALFSQRLEVRGLHGLITEPGAPRAVKPAHSFHALPRVAWTPSLPEGMRQAAASACGCPWPTGWTGGGERATGTNGPSAPTSTVLLSALSADSQGRLAWHGQSFPGEGPKRAEQDVHRLVDRKREQRELAEPK